MCTDPQYLSTDPQYLSTDRSVRPGSLLLQVAANCCNLQDNVRRVMAAKGLPALCCVVAETVGKTQHGPGARLNAELTSLAASVTTLLAQTPGGDGVENQRGLAASGLLEALLAHLHCAIIPAACS